MLGIAVLYADGGHAGAPQALQIADRFHLVLNLSGAIERVLEEHRRDLTLPPTESGASSTQPPSNAKPPTLHQLHRQQVRQSRMERYQQVIELYRQGYSQAAISRETGIERKTIRRWLRSSQFPERKTPCRQPSKALDYEEYLRRRWKEGCHNATRLFQEIRQQGYPGGRKMVAIVVSRWRKVFKAQQPKPQRISPKYIAILIARAPDKLTPENQNLLDRLTAACPELIPLRKLALEFQMALAGNNSIPMIRWIERARHSSFGPLVRFAYGLRKDLSAVIAAVETPWNSGQVEGQINRLKTIKRQMYGRSGFALLRARVLPYTTSLAFQPVAHAP